MSYLPNSANLDSLAYPANYSGGSSYKKGGSKHSYKGGATRKRKGTDGKYHVDNKTFAEYIGTRRKVFNETAYKTKGGLTKKDLLKNKHGRIVSRRKHLKAKKDKNLEKHGYFTKKGVFGYFKK